MAIESPHEVDQLYGEIIQFTDALNLPTDRNVMFLISQLTQECERIRNSIPKNIQLRAHVDTKKSSFEAIQIQMKHLLVRYFILLRKLDTFASAFFQPQRHPNRIYNVDYFQRMVDESNFPNVMGNILLQNINHIANDASEWETEREKAQVFADEVIKTLIECSRLEKQLEKMYMEMVWYRDFLQEVQRRYSQWEFRDCNSWVQRILSQLWK